MIKGSWSVSLASCVASTSRHNVRSLAYHSKLYHSLFFYLQKVFNFFSIIVATFTADTLGFTDVTSAAGSLNVFKVDQRILADVDDGSKIVVKAYIVM